MESTTKNWIWIGVLCIPTIFIAIFIPVILLLSADPGPDIRWDVGHYTLYSTAEMRKYQDGSERIELAFEPFDFLGDRIESGGLTISSISKKKYKSEGPQRGNIPSSRSKKYYSVNMSLMSTGEKMIEYIPEFRDESNTEYSIFDLSAKGATYLNFRSYIYWKIDSAFEPLKNEVSYLALYGGGIDSPSEDSNTSNTDKDYDVTWKAALFILDDDLEKLPDSPLAS